jgi:hypothetical protein
LAAQPNADEREQVEPRRALIDKMALMREFSRSWFWAAHSTFA